MQAEKKAQPTKMFKGKFMVHFSVTRWGVKIFIFGVPLLGALISTPKLLAQG